MGPDQNETWITFKKELYTIKDRAAPINVEAKGKAMFFVFKNGHCRLSVSDRMTVY